MPGLEGVRLRVVEVVPRLLVVVARLHRVVPPVRARLPLLARVHRPRLVRVPRPLTVRALRPHRPRPPLIPRPQVTAAAIMTVIIPLRR